MVIVEVIANVVYTVTVPGTQAKLLNTFLKNQPGPLLITTRALIAIINKCFFLVTLGLYYYK